MLTLQCESCGTLRDMSDEQVIELAKTPLNIPKCPKDGDVMWPIGADSPSDKMMTACYEAAKKVRPKETPMSREADRVLVDRIEKHIGTEEIISLAKEISNNAKNDGYGDSIDPSLATIIITYTLFRLMKEKKIALITRDKEGERHE